MLGFCRDPFVTQLYRLGYSLIPLPEAGMEPLDVYGRQGRELFRLGRLDALFDAGTGVLPSVTPNIEAAELKITRSSSLDSGLGASIVSDWLGKNQPEVAAKVHDLGKFSFQLKGVVKDRVDLVPLDDFLTAASMKSGAPFFRRMVDSDDVYVVTSLLKARSVLLSSTEKQAGNVNASLPAESGLPVGGKAKVEMVTSENAAQEFKASIPLAFAVQAVQICFLNGAYKTLRVDRSRLQLMSDDGRTRATEDETGWLSDVLGPYFPRIIEAAQ
jgi:hypothetical protein